MVLISVCTSGKHSQVEKFQCDVEALKRLFTAKEVETLLGGGKVFQSWADGKLSCVSELQK